MCDKIDKSEYPFESNYSDTNCGKLHYIDEGSGETILFIHGNPTWSFLYRNFINKLSKTHRCIAVDLLGFGFSEKPENFAHTPQNHFEIIQNFISELELQNLTLVLHDWGGPIGLKYAVSNPLNVSKIILFNTWMWELNGSLKIQLFSRFFGSPIGRTLNREFNFLIDILMPLAFSDKKHLKKILPNYQGPFANKENRRAVHEFAAQLTKSKEWLNELWQERNKIQNKEMLILWGMKDPAFGNDILRIWERNFPEASIKKFNNAGHFLVEEPLCKNLINQILTKHFHFIQQ